MKSKERMASVANCSLFFFIYLFLSPLVSRGGEISLVRIPLASEPAREDVDILEHPHRELRVPANHLGVLLRGVAPHAHQPLARGVDVGLPLGQLLLPDLGGVEPRAVLDPLEVLVLVARVDAVVVLHAVVVDRADVARGVGQQVGEVIADQVDIVLGLGVVVVRQDEGVAVGLEEVGDGSRRGTVEATAAIERVMVVVVVVIFRQGEKVGKKVRFFVFRCSRRCRFSSLFSSSSLDFFFFLRPQTHENKN